MQRRIGYAARLGELRWRRLLVRQALDRNRPAIIPVFVEGGADLLNNRSAKQQLKVAKISSFIQPEIFVREVSSAHYCDLVVDHHRLVMHAMVQTPEFRKVQKLARGKAAGAALERIEYA